MNIKLSDNQVVEAYFQYGTLKDADDKIFYSGITRCNITFNGQTSTGFSRCSKKDQFVKRIGRKVAFQRALEFFDFNKEQRTQLWRTVFPTFNRKS